MENVVKPTESDTSVPSTPSPSASPASAVSSTPQETLKNEGTTGAPAAGAGTKPEAKTVPLEALHEERTKRQALETKMAQLEQLFAGQYKIEGDRIIPSANQAAPVQSPPPDQAETMKRIEKMWDEDPKQAVRAEQMLAFEWYDNLQTAIDWQKDMLRSKYADFKTYESDVGQYVRKLPLAQRGQPGAVELAYLVVKGQKSQGIEETAKKMAYDEFVRKMQAGEAIQGVPAGSFSQPPASNSGKPTDDQMKAAQAMGVPVEEYMKYVR